MPKQRCIGRIAKVSGIMHFENGKNRFYLEYRCPNEQEGIRCPRCTGRTTDKIQSSGKFNHGDVNEPIPDASQMYGGKWYRERFEKYGVSAANIAIAEEHVRVARLGLVPAVVPAVIPDVIPEVVPEPVVIPAVLAVKPKPKPRSIKIGKPVSAEVIPKKQTKNRNRSKNSVDSYAY